MSRRVESVGDRVLVADDPTGIVGAVLQALLAEADEQKVTSLRKGDRPTVAISPQLVATSIGLAVWLVKRSDGVTLSIGGEELDRLFGQAYDLRRWQQMSRFPIGCTLDRGRYTIIELLRGTPDRGQYRARIAGSARHALVTLGTPQHDLAAAQARLALSDAAIAELLFAGRLESKTEPQYDGLVELEPEGTAIADDKIADSDAVPRALALARLVAGCHARGVIVGGLRPELIYLRPEGPKGGQLVPRCERFLLTATTPSYGVSPCFTEWYMAPEVLARPDVEPTGSADVFAIGVMLAIWGSGAHPFEGEGMQQMMSITIGRRHPWPGSKMLGLIVAATIATAPSERPTMSELVEWLEKYTR